MAIVNYLVVLSASSKHDAGIIRRRTEVWMTGDLLQPFCGGV